MAVRPTARAKRPRGVIAFVIVISLLIVSAVAAGSYILLRTNGGPGETAASYLSAWQRGNVAAMRELSVGVPVGGLAGPLAQVDHDLGVRGRQLRLGAVSSGPARTARATFTATLTLADGARWTYQGRLRLLLRSRHWWVNWSPAAIYPQLTQGERFRVTAVWPTRAAVLAANGSPLDSPQAVAESGSVEMLTGTIGPVTAAQLKQLGPPYQQGDMAGQGGIEQAYERRLAGTPRTSIELMNGRGVVATVANFGDHPGTPVQTSIDVRVQQAASRAIDTVSGYNVAMVAIRPSTGEVLAVVNKPGGFNRALLGTYPPGSTFKMITASALAVAGMRPSDAVQCPATINIGGRTFHNYNFEQFGTTNLLTAFAVSCNTTFGGLAAQRLSGGQLGAMAKELRLRCHTAPGCPGPPRPVHRTYREHGTRRGRFRPGHGHRQPARDGHGGRRDREWRVARTSAGHGPRAARVAGPPAEPGDHLGLAPDDGRRRQHWNRRARWLPARCLRQDRDRGIRQRTKPALSCLVRRLPRRPGVRRHRRGRRYRCR